MLRAKKVPAEEKSFKRRARPTPQATRLLVFSTLSGLALIVVLAAVFVPRGLQGEQRPPTPLVALAFSESPEWNVSVASVTVEAVLTAYQVELRVEGGGVVNRTPLERATGPPLTFVDADGDGLLSAGDHFLVDVPAGEYTLAVHHEPTGFIVGFVRFP